MLSLMIVWSVESPQAARTGGARSKPLSFVLGALGALLILAIVGAIIFTFRDTIFPSRHDQGRCLAMGDGYCLGYITNSLPPLFRLPIAFSNLLVFSSLFSRRISFCRHFLSFASFVYLIVTTVGSGKSLPMIVQELLPLSMLQQARDLIYEMRNDGTEWRRPYGNEQSRDLIGLGGDVWLDLYPASILAPNGRSVISIMGDSALWQSLQSIGFSVIHTNPLHRSGGVRYDLSKLQPNNIKSSSSDEKVKESAYSPGKSTSGTSVPLEFVPTCDGNYDRIMLQMDPLFGTDTEYINMTSTAKRFGGFVAGDVVPGHTGTGADWLLALLGYREYPYLYHMVSIQPKHWVRQIDIA